MNLTKTVINDYALPTTPQWVVGFGDSFHTGAGYAPIQVHGFFYALSFMVSIMGGRKTCRFQYPVRQPVMLTAQGLATAVGGKLTTILESTMGNLIPFAQRFIAGISTRTVSARKLHEFLGSKQDFSTWIKARIKQYSFEENTDYLLTLHKTGELKTRGLQGKTEYFLTIDMAKELAMVERNEKGKQARRYFINCEKKLLESKQKQLPESTPALPKAEQQFLMTIKDGETTVEPIKEDSIMVSKKALKNMTGALSYFRVVFDDLAIQTEQFEKQTGMKLYHRI